MLRQLNHKRSRLLSMASTVSMLALLSTACDDDNDGIVRVVVPPIQSVSAVSTFRDTTVDFSQMRTFAMPDSIVHFAPAGTAQPVSRDFDATILSRVRQNLMARGFTPAQNPETDQPDVIVLVAVTATDNQRAWVSYPWFSVWGFYSGFGWFTPGFDDTWGITYPWAGSATVGSFPLGTVAVDFIPTSSVDAATMTITAAWSGIAAGLLNGPLGPAGINAAVDEMFDQSPYLLAGELTGQL